MLCGIINDTRLLRLHSVRVLKIGAEHRCLCHVCIVVRAKHEIKHLALRCVCVCVCGVRAFCAELFNHRPTDDACYAFTDLMC